MLQNVLECQGQSSVKNSLSAKKKYASGVELTCSKPKKICPIIQCFIFIMKHFKHATYLELSPFTISFYFISFLFLWMQTIPCAPKESPKPTASPLPQGICPLVAVLDHTPKQPVLCNGGPSISMLLLGYKFG